MVKRFGFGKKEKLKSRRQIDALFANGNSFAVPPIRVIYRFVPSTETGMVKVGVTAGKKYFKKAKDRNRIKRLLREAYRLQKNELTDRSKEYKSNGYIFFTYTDKTIVSFDIISEAMHKCLGRLIKILPAHENHT